MPTNVTADEVTEFRTAVAGVVIDWVRTDEGFGPATMVSSGDDRVVASTGGLDFSTLLSTEIPDNRLVLQYVTHAPPGMSWCGSEARDFDLRHYLPGTSVAGNVPAGSRAVTVTAWLDPLQATADDLGIGQLQPLATVDALAKTPEVDALCSTLTQVALSPEVIEPHAGATVLLEQIARAVASVGHAEHSPIRRGISSAHIVGTCLDHALATNQHQPNISTLCSVASVSESRLRQAFVEVLGVSPNRYFQLRALSTLRDRLLVGDPGETTVTRAAASLGLTQLGRVAGRYRSLYGETPSETLRRHERRRR